MKPAELWRLTWAEFFALYAGWQRRNARQWEQTREVLAMIYNTAPHDGQSLTAGELIPLPTIDGPRAELLTLTAEEEAVIMARFGLTPPHPRDAA